MVYTFDLIELRTILRCIPNQVVLGDKSTLGNRLIYLSTSPGPQESIAIDKIIEAYRSKQTLIEQQKLPLVNQSYTPPIPKPVKPINGTNNEPIQFVLDHPFLKIIKTLWEPIYCPGKTDPTELEGFYQICPNIENFFGRKYKIEIILRLERFGLKSYNGYLPRNVNVTVNGHQCALGDMHFPISHGGLIKPHQLSVPIKLTEYSNLNALSVNTLKVSWSNEPHSYVAGVYMIHKLTLERLLVKLQNRPLRASEKTKILIKESMKSESDMNVDSMFTTIMDPISKLRMSMPARGVDCIHLQCFDAIHFIRLNEIKPSWSCPLCKKQVTYKNIEVDEFFLNIVQSPSLSKECENIILFKNATWAEKKNNERLTNNNGIITLSDSDDSS